MPLETSQIAVAGVAAIVGWWVGLVSVWLSDRLLRPNDAEPNDPNRPLQNERIVQTLVAAAWALLALSGGLTLPVAAAGLIAVPLIQVGVTDMRHRHVYALVAVCGLAASVVLSPVVHATSPWAGVGG